MNQLYVLLVLGAVIGSNNLAASFALGALGQRPSIPRVVMTFGLFEFLVPLAGLWLGQQASSAIADNLGWLGPALIAGLGVFTLYEALKGGADQDALAEKIGTRRGLLLLAAGLSIDNLVVGFGLGLGGMDPLLVAGTIALFSMSFSALGLLVGSKLGQHHRCMAELAAGVLLLGLAGSLWLGWI